MDNAHLILIIMWIRITVDTVFISNELPSNSLFNLLNNLSLIRVLVLSLIRV